MPDGPHEIDLTGMCEHCGNTEGEHWPGCISEALGFLALDEDDRHGFVEEVHDERGRL